MYRLSRGGDDLAVLEFLEAPRIGGSLRFGGTPGDPQGAATDLVWGVDLSRMPTRRDARRALRESDLALRSETRHMLALRRVVIVAVTHPAWGPRLALTLLRRSALRLSRELERRRGTHVEVVALDVTACDAPAHLAERVRDHLDHRTDLEAPALTWEAIEKTSIQRAAHLDDL